MHPAVLCCAEHWKGDQSCMLCLQTSSRGGPNPFYLSKLLKNMTSWVFGFLKYMCIVKMYIGCTSIGIRMAICYQRLSTIFNKCTFPFLVRDLLCSSLTYSQCSGTFSINITSFILKIFYCLSPYYWTAVNNVELKTYFNYNLVILETNQELTNLCNLSFTILPSYFSEL